MQLYKVVVQNKQNSKDTCTLLTKTPEGESRDLADLVDFLGKRIKLNYTDDPKRAIKSITLLNDINDVSVEESEDDFRQRTSNTQQYQTSPVKLDKAKNLEHTGPIQGMSEMDFRTREELNKSQDVKP